ncbi:MAG: ketoacyl-ACP synthase III [Lachnospiraceae bacterium]|nr:ketoacyl-ACP synthase III [Lachnospiraceae bacterium]
MNFKVIGTGSYVPDNVVTNDDLSKLVDTNDEWISKRVGIKERRISQTDTTLDMGTKASFAALENAGLKGTDIDLIVTATISGDTACPSTACMIQNRIGADCMAFDVSAACAGFLFAVETAMGYICRGKAKRVLIVCAERMSKLLDWTDRGTCVIFGDGAAAAVLEATEEGLYESVFNVKGGDDVLKIPATNGSSPFYQLESESPYLFMNGQETFKFAVNSITHDIAAVLENAGIAKENIAHVVPHQANKRIIDFAQKKTGIDLDKWYVNIDRYGNVSGASIPIALDEMNRSGVLKKGDKILLAAFGGGLASGALVFEW